MLSLAPLSPSLSLIAMFNLQSKWLRLLQGLDLISCWYFSLTLHKQRRQTNLSEKATHKHTAGDDIKNEFCVVFVPVVSSEAVRLERMCIFNWTCLLQIRTLSSARQRERSWWEPQMLHPRKRTQFAGIITLSRLHLDCHYFPLCSIQSIFTVWPVSSLTSADCLFTGTLSLLFSIASIFFLLALFCSTPCNNLAYSKFCKYRHLLFRNVRFLWEKEFGL